MIQINDELLLKLDNLCDDQTNNSIIFGFKYESLPVRCLYFQKTKVILIAFTDRSVAWQIDISNYKISEKIPNEAYRVIKDVLKDGKKYSNKPFFTALISKIELLGQGEIVGANNDDILKLLRHTRTRDSRYDKDGDKPFFNHWRRVRPSSESLDKIQRYFGFEIRQQCFKNGVTAVFLEHPTTDSLGFLDIEKQVSLISKLAEK